MGQVASTNAQVADLRAEVAEAKAGGERRLEEVQRPLSQLVDVHQGRQNAGQRSTGGLRPHCSALTAAGVQALATINSKSKTPVVEAIMKHAPHFEPSETADVEELEDWATRVRTFCTQLGVEETTWVPLVSTFCFKGGSHVAKYIAATNAQRVAQGELPLNTWQPLLDALKNAFGTASVLQDEHARDQLATLKALEYVKDADPVARYSADIQRLAILGNVGNQELTKLDAFRKGMPAELQRHCLTRPDTSKFETLSQLVTETTALLTAGLKEAAARAPAVRVGSVRAAAPSHAGASTSSGAQARSQRSPEAKRAKQDVGAKSWEVPSDLCTRCWAFGHRSRECASIQRVKPAECPQRPGGSGTGGAATAARAGKGGKPGGRGKPGLGPKG